MKYNNNNVVECKVTGIKDYGFFVKIDDECKGIVHISEISDYYVSNIRTFVKNGETIKLQVIGYDKKTNNYYLSYKSIRKHLIKKNKAELLNLKLGFKTVDKYMVNQIRHKLGEIKNEQN